MVVENGGTLGGARVWVGLWRVKINFGFGLLGRYPPAAEAAPFQSGARRLLRRGMFFNPGIVPPRAASLRAASRSVRAFRAFRSDALFFVTPLLSHRVVAACSGNSVGCDSRTAPGPSRLGCPPFEKSEGWGSLVL